MADAVLFGCLDTKGPEYAFLRDELVAAGHAVTLVDAGVLGEPTIAPDVSRQQVAAAAGHDIAALRGAQDRGAAIAAMAAGAAAVARELRARGALDGALAAGGSGTASIFADVAQALALGVPKLLVSTVATLDLGPYVRSSDLTVVNPIVDVAGLNRVTRPVLANAAHALSGMIAAPGLGTDRAAAPGAPGTDTDAADATDGDRPAVAATMFGVTTRGVEAVRSELESLGYEVIVFHATGAGGRAMESLIRSGAFAAVADITTTELADELDGGICSAGPERLRAAVECGVPQVVSLGALDMVNFGPRATVPERFADRLLYEHNPAVTLMRTDRHECAALGAEIATKLAGATAPTTVFVPEQGVSELSLAGRPLYDADADAALFDAVRDGLPDSIACESLAADVNAPEFAHALASRLHEQVLAHRPGEPIREP